MTGTGSPLHRRLAAPISLPRPLGGLGVEVHRGGEVFVDVCISRQLFAYIASLS